MTSLDISRRNEIQSGDKLPHSKEARAAYIHVPFCTHRCGYCNFTLVAGRDDLIPKYLQAIERELSQLGEPREVDTLFLGGGTPTQLPPAALAQLLAIVARWHPLATGGEFSVEANPTDVDAQQVAVLAAVGVTRISLGAQSFDDAKLAILERDHRADDIRRAIDLARPHFASISLDLIFAAPGETLDTWTNDLTQSLTISPDHLSIYGLTYERGAAFWSRRERGELQSADEELERAMYLDAIDRLTDAGFAHYEVSNFARPGHRCRHNDVYWSGGDYYAAGPGAARHVAGRRETNHRSTTTWLRRVLAGESPVAEVEQLGAEQRARERLVFALRRIEGVDRDWFADTTGYSIDVIGGTTVRRLVDTGLLADDGNRICLTRNGLLVSDSIWPELL